jgi:hypothetical protein
MEHIEVDPANTHEIVAVFDTSSLASRQAIVINEIMYHPLNSMNSEWIELYNPNNLSVSLEGFRFTDGGADNHFSFSSDDVINAMDYFVVAGDLANYLSEFGSSPGLTGSFNSGGSGFNLNNNGEVIYLKNAFGEKEDHVQYDNIAPWPEGADGGGPSLQLLSPDLDNTIPANWYASTTGPYSPGKQNGGHISSEEIHNEKQLLRVYPNPVGETLFIEVQDAFGPEMHVRLFSLAGMNVANAVFHAADHHEFISWNHGIKEPGAYLLQVFSNSPENSTRQTKLLIFTANH